jgi:hypothetical protein
MVLRRQFSMGKEDTRYLDANHPNWETIVCGANRVLLLHDFSVPNGYTVRVSTAAIIIPMNYPTQELDMVYFYPSLTRSDGQAIRQADVQVVFDGVSYQRWSRHYTITKWKPEEDNIATHVMAIRDWLIRALESRGVA